MNAYAEVTMAAVQDYVWHTDGRVKEASRDELMALPVEGTVRRTCVHFHPLGADELIITRMPNGWTVAIETPRRNRLTAYFISYADLGVDPAAAVAGAR